MDKLIVVAEDNAFVQKLLIGIFKHEGAHVIAVDDGLLAVEEINQQKPDLVVLDYQMPNLDGIKTCEKIRKRYSQIDLPVILLTADLINIVQAEAQANGINELIYKPIKGDELVECAQKLLDCNVGSSGRKVLDTVSDDLLKDELQRLQQNVITAYKAKDHANIKKYIHELCGIAGSSSKYHKLWEIAQVLDVKVNNGDNDNIESDIAKLSHIRIN